MPIDPNISLSTRQADIGTPINQAAVADQQMATSAAEQELATRKSLLTHYQSMTERDKQRLQGTVVAATRLKTYLDSGDVEGAHNFLTQRQNSIHDRMASGENIDDQETAYALDKLRTGDTQGLQNDIASIIAAGQVYGIGGSDDKPANIKEWEVYNKLSEEDKIRYQSMKRADKLANLGDRTAVIGPGGNINLSLPHGLAPNDLPENASAKAGATAAGSAYGKEQGEAQALLTAMEANMPALNQAVTKLKTLAKDASYNIFERGRDAIVRQIPEQLGGGATKGALARTKYETSVLSETLPLLRQTFGSQFTADEGKRLTSIFGDINKSTEEKFAALDAVIEQKTRQIESLSRQVRPVNTSGGQNNVIPPLIDLPKGSTNTTVPPPPPGFAIQ